MTAINRLSPAAPRKHGMTAKGWSPAWDNAVLSYPAKYLNLMSAWLLIWDDLKLEVPSELSISERPYDLLQFYVRRREMAASQVVSLYQVRGPIGWYNDSLAALSESLDNALNCRAGEVPVELVGRTA